MQDQPNLICGRPVVSAELTQRIRLLWTQGFTLWEICDVFNAEGIPTARGAPGWRPSALSRSLGYKRGQGHRGRPSGNRRRAGWWVYCLIGRGGSTLYVGMTSNLERRFRVHKEKAWWSDVARSRLHWYPTKTAARIVEREFIVCRKPPYNRYGTGQLPG